MIEFSAFIYDLNTEKHRTDIDDEDDDEEETTERSFKKEPMVIYKFGVTEDDKSVMIKINGFTPSFYIQLPMGWGKKESQILYKQIQRKYFASSSDGVVDTQFELHYQFDGFTNNTLFPYLKVSFDSMMSFYIYRKKFNNSFTIKQLNLFQHKFKLYQSDLDQLLSYLHIYKLPSCGWIHFEFKTFRVINISRCELQYEVNLQDIVMTIPVGINKPPCLYIGGFDIECSRGNLDGQFPQYDVVEDHINHIGVTISRYGTNEVCKKYISVLGSCDPIDGVVVEWYDDERKVILRALQYMVRENVHILAGYNIYGFDLRYMYKRACLLNIERQFLNSFSKFSFNGDAVYEEKQLVSSGLGDNKLYLLNIPGIVTLDVMKVLQGDPMIKLSSWKLDKVAEHFMGEKKHDLKPNEMFRLQKEGPRERKIIAEYCIQDCVLVNNLINKLSIVTNKFAMAEVCSVPLTYILLRGQGIKIFSLVAKMCREKNFLMPTKDRSLEKPDTKYQGAVVLEMKRNYYTDPIFVLDFNSLYPSCQRTANLSHDTFVEPSADHIYGNIPGVTYREISFVEDEKTFRYKWAKIPGQEGIIPQILKILLDERNRVKELMENEKDMFTKEVLNGKQNALKVTCNSMYGQCGAFTSNIYHRELASCTTALGREFIIFSRDYVLRNYDKYECIYGDTDSIFVKPYLPNKSTMSKSELLTEVVRLGKQIGGEITAAINHRDMKLAYEKVFYPFGMLNPKRYIGMKYVKATSEGELITMGDAMKRRDSAPIVKFIYKRLLDMLFRRDGIVVDPIHVVRDYRNQIMAVLDGKYPMDQFIITVTLRSHYKNEKSIPHKVLADRMTERDPGNAPETNDRMAFVFIEVLDKKVTVPGENIESPEFVLENNLHIDYLHYVTNQINKPVQTLLDLFLVDNKGPVDDIIEKYKKNRKQDIRKTINHKSGFREIGELF
jgi:DNA polymerase delta subunit 1